MAASSASAPAGSQPFVPDPNEDTLLGHPKGLFVLFFAELWERFCYYGMRALLALHIAKEFFPQLSGDAAQEAASGSYGGFTALVYALGIFGGTIADRVLGYRRSIILGGLIMAVGEFMLMSSDKNVFYAGLATLIVGNGLFKPNISSLVGKLYKQGDPRRDGGFTVFYMGINIGAFLAPLACEAVSSAMGGYRYGFMLAGAGMILGVVCFGLGGKFLQGKGLAPAGRQGQGPLLAVVAGCALVVPVIYLLLSLSEDVVGYILYATFGAIILFLLRVAVKEVHVVKQRMFVLVLLLILNAVFWMGFEQAGNALNFFAEKQLVPFSMGGWSMPAEWWQSVNAILIVALGPVFAALWVLLDRRSANPSIPAKFAIGLIGMGLGFSVLILGINGADPGGKVMWSYLLGLYFVHTMGELCLSPVGLSMVTKLAPERMTGMVMGSWFISIATGNFLAGKISSLIAERAKNVGTALEKVQAYGAGFTYVLYIGVGVGAVLLIASKTVNKLMHGVK